MPLTNTECKNTKPRAKPYKMADGGGLHLFIKPNSSKLWRMKYRFLKKEKLLSFGKFPTVSLGSAREEREVVKKLLAEGIDPSVHKKKQKQTDIENTSITF